MNYLEYTSSIRENQYVIHCCISRTGTHKFNNRLSSSSEIWYCIAGYTNRRPPSLQVQGLRTSKIWTWRWHISAKRRGDE